VIMREHSPEFADFVASRYGDLLRTAYLLTGSHHAAEDLVQACLLKVMPRWDGIAEPMTDLRRIMVNQRVSWWRRLRRELPQADPPDGVAPDGAGGAAERTTVLAALAGPPPRRDGHTLVTASTGVPGSETRAPAAAVYYAGREPYVQEPMPGSAQSRVIAFPYGTATAASSDLVAVRPAEREVDDFRPVAGDRILVVAPPSATRLKVGSDTVALTGGVGFLTVPGPVAPLTLTAVDASGATVATGRYGEPDATGQFFGEPVVDAWTA
jgi:hypothetical protein